jgi:hypothetical protein
MTIFKVLVLFNFFLFAHAQIRFDSATTVGLDASLQAGSIISYQGDSDDGLKNDIQDQLMYLIGTFNNYSSTPDIGHVKIQILSRKPIPGTDEQLITYNAKFMISWDRKEQIPTSMQVYLPKSIIKDGNQDFFESYSKNCSLDPDSGELDVYTFYYWYRPQVETCGLAQGTYNSSVSNMNILKLRLSGQNSVNKYPEYDKIWEDGKLVYTVIFAANQEGATANSDYGVNTFNNFYNLLINKLGRPYYTYPKISKITGPNGFSNPRIEMKFRTSKGDIVVNMFMLDKYGIQNPPFYFTNVFSELTKVSDVISYNGHSAYEANIKALASQGTYTPGRYHIFYINGCDTFSYVDDTLRSKISTISSSSTDYEHVDMILNTMPSFYGEPMYSSNANLLISLLNSDSTYRKILSYFHDSQKAVVIGEEDNRFIPSL